MQSLSGIKDFTGAFAHPSTLGAPTSDEEREIVGSHV